LQELVDQFGVGVGGLVVDEFVDGGGRWREAVEVVGGAADEGEFIGGWERF
jgi:hypothetical protein